MQAFAAKIAAYYTETIIKHSPVIEVYLVTLKLIEKGHGIAGTVRNFDVTSATGALNHAM